MSFVALLYGRECSIEMGPLGDLGMSFVALLCGRECSIRIFSFNNLTSSNYYVEGAPPSPS